jgi:Peptidase C39 family
LNNRRAGATAALETWLAGTMVRPAAQQPHVRRRRGSRHDDCSLLSTRRIDPAHQESLLMSISLRGLLSRRGATILALLLPLAGCASGPRRLEPLSASATVLATPLVEQDELHECGLAALSSLCGYYQVTIPDAQRQELARLAAENDGLSGAELRTALEGLGFEVYIFEGSFDRAPTGVLNHIEQGRPLLVMTRNHDQNHYSLLIGHDPELGNVVLLDPLRGRELLPDEVFQRLWSVVRHFTLLAVPAAPTGVGLARTTTPVPEIDP